MRVLLVDADILVYRFGLSHQKAIQWDAETWTYEGNFGDATRAIEKWAVWLKEFLGADVVEYYLSDPHFNWRHSVYPDYKGSRAAWSRLRASDRAGGLPPKEGPQRPMLYKALRQYFEKEKGAIWKERLEGDDCLGIAATRPARFNGERVEQVVVSVDKDLRTIPGLLFNPDLSQDGIRKISKADADRFHLLQTLMGDKVDNYPGCPGVGPVKAEKILTDAIRGDGWPSVVGAYEKAGLTEDDALVQARVARVCRHGDYNEKTKEVTLWTPTR